MNELSKLSPVPGSRKNRKRVGRGPGSGTGKTAGRGHKGQKARSSRIRPGFEGGQMPIIRRVPIRGFRAFDPTLWSIVNVQDLNAFPAGTEITPEVLADAGIIRKSSDLLKILGNGDLSVMLSIKAHKFSKSAEAKIAGAGGKAEVIGG